MGARVHLERNAFVGAGQSIASSVVVTRAGALSASATSFTRKLHMYQGLAADAPLVLLDGSTSTFMHCSFTSGMAAQGAAIRAEHRSVRAVVLRALVAE